MIYRIMWEFIVNQQPSIHGTALVLPSCTFMDYHIALHFRSVNGGDARPGCQWNHRISVKLSRKIPGNNADMPGRDIFSVPLSGLNFFFFFFFFAYFSPTLKIYEN